MRIRGAVGPSYSLSTVPLDAQRTYNLYTEPDELQTGKDGSIGALVTRPGLTKLLQLPLGPVRGMWRVSSTGQIFAVGGNIVFEIKSDWSYSKVGVTKTYTGSVSISDNGKQVIIVDGVYGYLIDLGNMTLTQITDGAFYSSNKVIFLDGYFVLVKPDSDQVYVSGLYDGSTYNALDFITIEASPDKTVTVEAYKNQLVAFGERSLAFYYTSDTIFTRVQGAQIEYGCIAPLSVAKDGDTLIWLAQNEYGSGVVMKAVGYGVGRASNYGVELAIQGYSSISDATAFAFQMRGHTFYALNFTSADTTWVMDVALGTWSEWTTTKTDGTQGRWRANCHVFGFDTHLVGDYENGIIYKLDFSAFTDNGTPVMRRRRIPPVSNNLKRMIHNKVQLDLRVGTATDAGQGQQPQVMMRYSDDGGLSWSRERWAGFGMIGQTVARCFWRMLGQSRLRVYEFTITDPVDVAIMGVDLDATPGAS